MEPRPQAPKPLLLFVDFLISILSSLHVLFSLKPLSIRSPSSKTTEHYPSLFYCSSALIYDNFSPIFYFPFSQVHYFGMHHGLKEFLWLNLESYLQLKIVWHHGITTGLGIQNLFPALTQLGGQGQITSPLWASISSATM